MKINKCKLKSFGKFHDMELAFSDGINIIRGDNESGKSTLHSFIRSMLFGMTRQRGRASRNDMYSRYEPIDNPAFYAGSLSFESGGKDFTISRNFTESKHGSFVCDTDGELLSLENGDLNMLLGDVSEITYDNTVSIGQMKTRTDKALDQMLSDYTSNFQSEMSVDINLDLVMKRLKQERKSLNAEVEEHKEKLLLREKQIRQRIDFENEEMAEKERKRKVLREQIKSYRSEQKIHERELLMEEDDNRSSLFLKLAVIVILILTFLGVFILRAHPAMQIAVGLAGIIFLLVIGRMLYADSKKRRRKSRKNENMDLPKEPDIWDYKETITKLSGQCEYLEQEIKEHMMRQDGLREDEKEAVDAFAVPIEEEADIEALDLAMRTIETLARKQNDRLGVHLRRRLSEILRLLTDGRYEDIIFSDGREPLLKNEDRLIDMNRASVGTIDQVYFAMRMAVAELFVNEEELPLLLDEVFAMYDDKRLERALTYLGSTGRQILLFTCRDREEEIMRRLGMRFHKVILGEHP